MQRFRTHYLALSVAQRHELAAAAGTTTGTLNQVVYAGKRIELGLADCLVALCPGLELGDMPLTDRALQQRRVREAPPVGAVQGSANPSDARAAANCSRRTEADPDGDPSPFGMGAEQRIEHRTPPDGRYKRAGSAGRGRRAPPRGRKEW